MSAGRNKNSRTRTRIAQRAKAYQRRRLRKIEVKRRQNLKEKIQVRFRLKNAKQDRYHRSESDMAGSIELHAAHVWDCDECGRENFERAVEGDMDEPTMQTFRDEEDGAEAAIQMLATEVVDQPDGQCGAAFLISRIAIVPKVVTCKYCEASFQAEVPCIEEPDSDDAGEVTECD